MFSQRMTRSTPILGTVAAALLLLSLTSCSLGSATTAAASASTTTPAAHPAASASAAASPADTAPSPSQPATEGSTGATTSGSLPVCVTAGLKGTVDTRLSGQQTVNPYIVLTNISTVTCTVQGFPLVTFVGGGNGAQVGAGATFTPTNPHPVVTLQPGSSAYIATTINVASKYPTADCKPTPADGIRVYPPKSSTSLYIAMPVTVCSSKTLSIVSVDALQSTKLFG